MTRHVAAHAFEVASELVTIVAHASDRVVWAVQAAGPLVGRSFDVSARALVRRSFDVRAGTLVRRSFDVGSEVIGAEATENIRPHIDQVLSERRTKEEWGLLLSMHRGYYPLVDNQPMNGGQGFRRTRPMQTEPGPDGHPPDNRHPMDKAL